MNYMIIVAAGIGILILPVLLITALIENTKTGRRMMNWVHKKMGDL